MLILTINSTKTQNNKTNKLTTQTTHKKQQHTKQHKIQKRHTKTQA